MPRLYYGVVKRGLLTSYEVFAPVLRVRWASSLFLDLWAFLEWVRHNSLWWIGLGLVLVLVQESGV